MNSGVQTRKRARQNWDGSNEVKKTLMKLFSSIDKQLLFFFVLPEISLKSPAISH